MTPVTLEMISWKAELKKRIEELESQIAKNELNAEITRCKSNIIEATAKKLSEQNRDAFFEKYGQVFRDALENVTYKQENSELREQIRELKWICSTIDEWLEHFE